MARSNRTRTRERKAAPAPAAAPTPQRWLPPVLLVVLTGLVYARSLGFPVVYWDDTQYLYEDARVQALTLENLWRIVSESYFSNYHPLTTLTYALDHAVWGNSLAGFHLTHLVFYAAGVVVLYFLFARLLGNDRAALLAAALYAVHTIHVEPVVWLAQRKDLLCLVLYAGAILAWARYRDAEAPPLKRRLYLLVLGLAAAAMLAKGYAVVLPAALFAYDLCFAPRPLKRMVVEQLPLVALAAVVTVLTVVAQETALAESETAALTFDARLVLLLKVFAVYTGRALLPVSLSVHYPVGAEWLPGVVAVLGLATLVASIVLFVRSRQRLPAVAFGLVLYLLPLATVMNLFWTLPTWINDRYLFFPTVGSSLALVAAGQWLVGRRPTWRRVMTGVGCATIALYAVLTLLRMGVWQSELLLWSDALRHDLGIAGSGVITAAELPAAVPPSSARAVIFVAKAYSRDGDQAAATAILGRLKERPSVEGLGFTDIETLARDAMQRKRFDDAVQLMQAAAARSPARAARAHLLAGLALEQKGDTAQARASYLAALEKAREGSDDATSALLSLGSLDFFAGDFKAAAERYEAARQRALPNDPRAAFYLGLALERLGQAERAYGLYDTALALEGKVSPNVRLSFSDVRKQKALAAEVLGRPREALDLLDDVLRRDPKHPEALSIRLKIGQLAEALGDKGRAVTEYRRVLELAPNHPDQASIKARLEQLDRR